MKTYFSKFTTTILSSLFIVGAIHPLTAAEGIKDRVNEWINSCPYIGLVAKEVKYGPITLKNLDLEHNGRIVIAQPGEEVEGTVRYKIDSDQLDSWHLHHIIVGIKGQDAQKCITHLVGIRDAKGKGTFSFKAPLEKGVYEIRFGHQTSLSCKDAIKAWQEHTPSSEATVGIVIVE